MNETKSISAVARQEIRFNECDPLGIVWHGNYVKYFEEGREAFGKKYGLDYMELYVNGYATPIVHLECFFRKTLQYKDVALIEVIYRKTEAAKIIFDYTIRKESSGELVCTGSTTQVFVANGTMQLALVTPEVFSNWRRKNNL